MLILATDLDRTLFPNGLQPDDGSLPRLRRFLEARPDIILVYVTGRHARETAAGIREYAAPFPAYAVCEVGTRIYRVSNRQFRPEAAWVELVRAGAPGWNRARLDRELRKCARLRPQPAAYQNPFKISYFLEQPQPSDARVEAVRARLSVICPAARAIYSVDEPRRLGLLDILPRAAGKLAGLEYVRRIYGLALADVVYAGDSGNDLAPLASGCRSILVRNARDDVRKTLRRTLAQQGRGDRLYCARGAFGLSGYYAAGIIEGLIHFGVMPPETTA